MNLKDAIDQDTREELEAEIEKDKRRGTKYGDKLGEGA